MTDQMDPAARRVTQISITGRVQGVFFRSWTVRTASALGLDGWVRNREDGSVEALAAGPADQVDRLIAACHEGPDQARVENVAVTELYPEDDPGRGGFTQRETA